MRSSLLSARPSFPLLAALSVLTLAACGQGSPANPLAGPGDGPGGPNGGPGGPGPNGQIGGGPGAEQGAETFVLSRELTLTESLSVVALGAEICCNGEDEFDMAPARFFVGSDGDAAPFGLVGYIGKDDVAILGEMQQGGGAPKELWRSAKPMARAGSDVTITIPIAQLPGGSWRLWAGRGAPLQVDGAALAEQDSDASIPYILVSTGRAASAAPGASKAGGEGGPEGGEGGPGGGPGGGGGRGAEGATGSPPAKAPQ